jgi:hypothetical protein
MAVILTAIMKSLSRCLLLTAFAAVSLPSIASAFNSLDAQSFFETGRLRSEDRILLQKPRSQDIPLSPRSNSWQFVIFRAEGFSQWLPPGVITHENVTLETPLGKIPFGSIASNSDKRRYVVAYTKELTDEQLTNPKVLLTAIRDRVAPVGKYKLIRERNLSLDTHPGRELTLESTDTTLTIRAYLVDRTAYVLGVSEPKTSQTPRSTRAFLNAFQLVQ